MSVLKCHNTESSFLLRTQIYAEIVYLIKGSSIKSSQQECLSVGKFEGKSILDDFCKIKQLHV